MLFAVICALFGPQVITPSAPDDFTVDAFFNDWRGQARFVVDEVRTGSVKGPSDLSGYARIGFDAQAVYFALEIADDRFVPGGADEGDRVFIRFAEDEDGTEIQVILNTLEVRPPTVAINGGHCPQCKGAGTIRRDGWAVEFSVPHDRLPGFDGGVQTLVVTVHDTDAPGRLADATVSTGTARTLGERFELDTVADARASYLEADRTQTPVIGRHRMDLWGSPLTEEVHINGKDVVLLGQDLPGGAAYMYFTHEWRPEAKVVRINTRELDGRPGKEILVYRQVKPRPDETLVEVVDVFGLYKGNLRRRFSQVVGVDFGEGLSARTSLKIEKKARRASVLVIEPATVNGVTKATYRDPDPTETVDAKPLPLPWSHKRARYRLRSVQWGP